MKKFKFTIQGNKYDVNIVNVEDNIAEIEVNGATYQVEVDKVISQSKTPKLVRSVAVPSTDTTLLCKRRVHQLHQRVQDL